MAYFITDKCIGCSICEVKCPTDTIIGQKKGLYEIVATGCIDCGTCGIWCPVDAIEDSYGVLVKGVKPKDIPKAKVDEDGCIACEYCVDACPFDCITMQPHFDGQYPMIAVVDEKKCVGCRLCEESCIWEAIYMDGDRFTGLSQNPIKDTFFDKIMPQDAFIHKDNPAGFMLKKNVEAAPEKDESASSV